MEFKKSSRIRFAIVVCLAAVAGLARAMDMSCDLTDSKRPCFIDNGNLNTLGLSKTLYDGT